MRKTLICIMISLLTIPAFANYTLTSDDQKVVDTLVQKMSAVSSVKRDKMIEALKQGQIKTTDEKKRAIFAATEARLRSKTAQGHIIATRDERKNFIAALQKNTNEKSIAAKITTEGSLETSDSKKVTFSGTLDESVDLTNLLNPKVGLNLDFSGMQDNDSVSGALEMRFVDSVMYFQLKKLDASEASIKSEIAQIQTYIGTWWKLPLADMVDSLNTVLANSANSSEQKEIARLFSQYDLVPKLTIVQNSDGTIYAGNIDNKALIGFIESAAATKGQTLSSSDKKEIKNALSHMTFSVTATLDSSSRLKNIKINIIIKNAGNDIQGIRQGIFTINMSLSSPAPSIVAPVGAKDLDTNLLM